ncbi:RpiB/LacA/LacB family sugar-phosphate isomerase [Candidatus Pacearchaeota archaeon]|nr:RpiB/LacA/LacB family sugar-phosphate isomerase [Candidatus Pacearchaeota archaeon]
MKDDLTIPKTIHVEGIEVPIGSHESKKIVIGADHRGFGYKNSVIEALKYKNYQLIDVGTFSSARCDYPAISNEIGRLVSEDYYYNTVGIGICGSGIGILIPASKYRGVYSARCLTPQEAAASRKHNNTNVLGIGADSVGLETALAIVDIWLTTPFYSSPSDEPYLKRFVQTAKLETAIIKS